jgi:hypothetical protein
VKLTVFSGTLVHASGGETGFGTAPVYFPGIRLPSANADVASAIPGFAGGLAAGAAAGG